MDSELVNDPDKEPKSTTNQDTEPTSTDNENTASSKKTSRGLCSSCYVPRRYIVTCLLGLGMLLIYAMRTNVGVTVVMILDERAMEKLGTVEAMEQLPNVYWDSRMIGFLHSVFYIGYLTSQIPGAFFTTVWPANRLYGVCILFSALLNLLLPVCIGNDLYVMTCIVRCCQGLAEGLLYPACYAVLRHWSAPTERSRQVSMVLTCAYAGAILGFPTAGLITHYLGWQYVYYVFGSACILWYLVWTCLSYEKPSHHKSISDHEYEYMTSSQGQDVIDYENLHVPWKSILKSLPVVAICLCHFARHWVLVFMLTNEPLYLNAFGFNIAETGVFASLPHISKVVLSLLSGHIADALLNAQYLSTTAVRKLLTGIGFGFLGISFIVLTFLGDGAAVIAVLTFAFGMFGLSTSGWCVNHYDLSTRHASTLVAVTSTFGTTGAIIVPIVVGVLTPNQTLEGWDNVFYVTAAILTVSVIFFLIFGSGDQQSWANPPPSLQLVQKEDPLACKPYKIHTLKQQPLPSQAKPASNATDKTELIPAASGNNYGTDMATKRFEHELTKKLDGDS